MEDVIRCYRNASVRKRMLEFMGAANGEEFDAPYIMKTDLACFPDLFKPDSPFMLDTYLEGGFDISRSLWDRKSLIAHLDLEFVNLDCPTAAYLDPCRAFRMQEPVVGVVEETLAGFGISSIHLITGRGHHFVWKILKNSPAFGKLREIGQVDKHLEQYYAWLPEPFPESVSADLGRAFSGLGMAMEFLAHSVKQASSSLCCIPVEITEVSVARGAGDREMVCIDITEYADPINTRIIRLPFSVYLKPCYREAILRGQSKPLNLFVIPIHEMDTSQALLAMRSPEAVSSLSRRTTAHIPDCSTAMIRLIDAYSDSSLASFHRMFYSQQHDLPFMWPHTYDRFNPGCLSPDIGHALEHPNDLLLKPSEIRGVVRSLSSENWHPRHIAGLIRSKYERDYGWGRTWYLYDAATRADFYARLFAGETALGSERSIPQPSSLSV